MLFHFSGEIIERFRVNKEAAGILEEAGLEVEIAERSDHVSLWDRGW